MIPKKNPERNLCGPQIWADGAPDLDLLGPPIWALWGPGSWPHPRKTHVAFLLWGPILFLLTPRKTPTAFLGAAVFAEGWCRLPGDPCCLTHPWKGRRRRFLVDPALGTQNFGKYDGFWGLKRALQAPRGARRAQERPSGGLWGPLGGLLEASLRLKMAKYR